MGGGGAAYPITLKRGTVERLHHLHRDEDEPEGQKPPD